jgi:acetyl/propionyl-CoA carboxylase alpha subunit
LKWPNPEVDAIHPVLSENADFAEKAEQNNIILLGLSQKPQWE